MRIGAKMEKKITISRECTVCNQSEEKRNMLNQIKESSDTKNLVTDKNMVNIEAVARTVGIGWLLLC